jgi:predicted lipoprotein with Yx(FWY)xxD motif
MSGLRLTSVALVTLGLACAGCGGEDGSEQPRADERGPTVTEPADTGPGEQSGGGSAAPSGQAASNRDARRPPGEDGLRVAAERARIVAKDSEFGRVLFDANGQVIYVFEIDRRNRSNCTSEECVEAWPPVLTVQEPSAGAGVDARLLGTIRRDDGSVQVTYNGRPLYFYAHEAPGEIKCHNVDLHGGLWWVVTTRGEPAD